MPSDVVNLREERLGGLQSLRAIAALFVVLQHAIYYVCVARGIDFMQYLQIGFGGLGVNLFFVISGFIMAGCTYQGRWFLWNRVLRIYPGYWLAIAVSGLLLIQPLHGWTFSLQSLFLTPSPLNSSYHIPYWTLVYEMGFYLVVALLIAVGSTPRAMARFCLLWLLVVAVVSRYMAIPIAEPGLWLWLAPHNIFFISGMLLGLHYRQVARIPSLLLGIAAIVFWTLGESLYGASAIGALMLSAVGLTAVVILAIRHVRLRPLEYVGDASYGMYLIHAPILVLSVHLLQRWVPGLSLLLLFAASMLLAVVGSIAFGRGEYALNNYLKKRWRPRRR